MLKIGCKLSLVDAKFYYSLSLRELHLQPYAYSGPPRQIQAVLGVLNTGNVYNVSK